MPSQKVKRPPAKIPIIDPAIGLGLVVAVFMVYGQVSHFDFIHYDDPVYVYQNAHVQAGLTLDSIKWPRMKTAIAVGGAASCLACMAIASTQTSYWQDGDTLFRHAADVGENNYWANHNLM